MLNKSKAKNKILIIENQTNRYNLRSVKMKLKKIIVLAD